MPAQLTRTLTFVPVRDGLWRVVGRSGAVLGHVECLPAADGERFQARRLIAGTVTRVLGEFCRQRDAEDCFR